MRATRLTTVLAIALASLAGAPGAWAHAHKHKHAHKHARTHAGTSSNVGAVQTFSGTVVSAQDGHVVVQAAHGSARTLNLPADALDFLGSYSTISLSVCENVSVSFEPASGGLELDSLVITGQASPGCVEQDGVSSLAAGTLVSVGSSGFTVDVPGLGAVSFGQDPGNSLTDGYDQGDGVLVAFTRSADGSLTASDVEDAIAYTTGTVTSVNNETMKVRERTTGKLVEFSLDVGPSVKAGDAVGIVYYDTSSGPMAEHIDDFTNHTTA